MPVTPLFAALFAIIYVYLSIGVIRQRLGKQVALGDGGDKELLIAIRAHGNFMEYVPLSLLLLWFIETVMYDSRLAFLLGSMLLLGRVCHVLGLKFPKKLMILRQLGMLATFGVLLASAGRLIWHYLPY